MPEVNCVDHVVAALNDRTQAAKLLEQFETFWPVTETAIGIDVAAIADMHNTAAPRASQSLRVLRRTVRDRRR